MNLFRTQRATPAPEPTLATKRRRSRGQVIVIFAGAMLAFMGLMAIVIDVSWYWANTLRVQRAADAAALAGVVWLPNLYSSADVTARAEAKKNGYEAGVNGTTIATMKDPNNDRKLIVTIGTPVPSFFARVIGIQSFPISRTSKAEFILPVAMGSPQNFYGVFGTIRKATFTGPTTSDTGFKAATAAITATECTPTSCNWTTTSNLYNKTVATNSLFSSSTTTNLSQQGWGQWNFGVPAGATIKGIEVQLVAKLGGGVAGTTCKIGVQLSPDGGTSWYPGASNAAVTANLATVDGTYTVGSPATTAPWIVHPWVAADFGSSAATGFEARLTWNQGDCNVARFAMVDTLTVRVTYTAVTTSPQADKQLDGPGTTCANGLTDCKNPDGPGLTPANGFWGTMNTEGAANVNGDAFQPYYDSPTSTAAPPCPTASIRACYDNINYYNYAIDMPAGSSGGLVYIFDPVFCATQLDAGTGDRWFGAANPVSSWYELYNTNNTPYNLSDDTLVQPDTAKFTNIAASDTSMGGSGGSECKQTSAVYGDGRDYHDSWYVLNAGAPLSGGANGTVYRLHTTGTDPTNGAAQRNTDGEQSFSIYASAFGGTPAVYGLGAMQMFTPLTSGGGSTFSEFYIAQVPAAHAGKTLELSLWDPGDTKPLAADVQIEIPTGGGWSPVAMTWSAVTGTSNGGAQNCSAYPAGSGNSVTTNVGNTTGTYNGCWLVIDVVIPVTYTAQQQGWWKIRYNMTGSGTSSDVTTWTAKIRGNPVHLVLP